jgi:hypothetical protein
MNKNDAPLELFMTPRPSKSVSLSVPLDTFSNIERIAASRDMAPEALMKLYIGQGLRQDSAQSFSERLIATTAEVLARHIASEQERIEIIQEIRGKTAA